MLLPRYIYLLTIFGLSLLLPAAETGHCSDSRNRTGVITGRVTDSLGGSPLAGASVILSGTSLGAAADTAGRFEIQNIPPGRYTVNIRRIAYQPKTVADIAVAADGVTYIDVRLSQMPVEIDETVVRGRFRPWVAEPSPPSMMVSSEEIRGVPGTLSDVTRVINLHPGVAKVGEVTNVQVVRGGTPGENGFYLDGIEVSNLNHFPIQGSSAGLMGLVNADFIEQARFYPGGFSAEYGDRLSSITEVAYREGTREGFAGNFNLHVAGFGLAAEGPLAGGRGSWLFSGRRSFLDVFADAIGVGNAPGYSDCQGKAVYDLSSNHTLSFLVIGSADDFSLGRETSEEDDKPEYGDWSGYQYTAGAIWRYDRPDGGYSITSLAVLGLRTRWHRYFTSDRAEEASEDSYERAIQLRHVSCRRFGPMVELVSGVAVAELNSDFGLYTSSFWNPLGGSIPSMTVKEKVHATRTGLFAALHIAPLSELMLSAGARLDHFEYTDRAHLSPRFSFSLGISDGTVLTGATGVYRQSLPLVLLVQHDRHKQLADPRAIHYVLGIRHSWSETVSFLMETYLKAYDRLPLDSALPQLFVLDELVGNEYIGHHLRLADEGTARSYGVEVTLRREAARGLYGVVCGSYSISRYRDMTGTRRNRVIDHRGVFTAECGFIPDDRWRLGLRWVYAGGRPYAPLDLESSRFYNRTVFDVDRLNKERLPDYHVLDIRIGRRFRMGQTWLDVYISVWNVYDHRNIYACYWDTKERKEKYIYQWGILPLAGIEYRF